MKCQVKGIRPDECLTSMETKSFSRFHTALFLHERAFNTAYLILFAINSILPRVDPLGTYFKTFALRDAK